MGKKHRIFIVLFTTVLLMAGCGREGRLDEGDCPVEIRLAGLPTGYSELTKDQKEMIEVNLQLENEDSGKRYTFRLNEDNHFSQDASLKPGTYRVTYCDISGNGAVKMEGEASVKSTVITTDTINIISVNVINEAEFNRWVTQMRPDTGILRAEQFSRTVQFEGEIINLEDILDYLDFTYDRKIRARDEAVIHDRERGVYVTLYNDTKESASWKKCKVIGVRFTKDNVLFGKGARVRMPAEEILHAKDGIYGTPDSLKGCVLIGTEYGGFDAIYHDIISGDRMTVKVDDSGEYITEISYDFSADE